jgi:hypothetical protein
MLGRINNGGFLTGTLTWACHLYIYVYTRGRISKYMHLDLLYHILVLRSSTEIVDPILDLARALNAPIQHVVHCSLATWLGVELNSDGTLLSHPMCSLAY